MADPGSSAPADFIDRRSAALDVLAGRGAAELAHPGGTLLAHLKRVADLLRAWNTPEDLQLAGLCHAAYGTDGYPTALLDLTERPVLAETIGIDAETIVYLYACCDRSQVYPQLGQESVSWHDRFTGDHTDVSGAELRALLALTVANEFDVIVHSAALAAQHGDALDALFARAARHLPPETTTAWRAARSAS